MEESTAADRSPATQPVGNNSAQREIETGSDHLLATVRAGVATLVMNRPKRRNALSAEMLSGLGRALAELQTADDVRCVVLTGAGGAFCAGGDVVEFARSAAEPSPDASVGLDRRVHQQRLSQRATVGAIRSLPLPVIAAVPGPAAGAGLSLALACDLRVAARGAIFTTAFARVGFSGDFGGSWFLTRLVGEARAAELYLLSERVDAEEALRVGLVNRLYPAETFAEEVEALARRLAEGPAVAYRYMKENIHRSLMEDLESAMDREVMYHQYCGTTRDHREAAAAFVAKRPPVFRGE